MDNGAGSYRRFRDERDENGLAEIIRDHSDGLILYINSIVGNIHTADDLDTGDDGGKNVDIVRAPLIECTVDTVANSDPVFHRFYVDIGCTLTYGVVDHILYHDNDG